LGFIAFGGPQAHVAILRDHLVEQRDWLDEDQFIELFAIGQGLPGPTSTQLVVAAALARAGPLGGLLAFFLWNIPGLVVLTTCGVLISSFVDPNNSPWYLIGLPPAAISLVFKAFYEFAAKLDKLGVVLALISCLVAILINNDANIDPTSSQFMFPSVLAFGGLVTWLDSKRNTPYGKYSSPSRGWDAEDDETMKRTPGNKIRSRLFFHPTHFSFCCLTTLYFLFGYTHTQNRHWHSPMGRSLHLCVLGCLVCGRGDSQGCHEHNQRVLGYF
jgi:chromate transport protein ChrA